MDMAICRVTLERGNQSVNVHYPMKQKTPVQNYASVTEKPSRKLLQELR